ncbi:MAG TPA: HD domain-containing protein [Candidatus Saccharimonadales bacterium]|nr:HD domain-containing protein [Candidatus Saccharimonadales bacterium]
MKDKFIPIVNLLFEVGMLAKTPRSFSGFLGSGQQSVAEHTNRVIYIGFVLAMMESDVDVGKIMKMCLFHDLAEARTGDLNYVNQKYVESDEEKVIQELAATLPFGDEILAVLDEYKQRQTKEAILAKDADNIEFILSLKEQLDTGNTRAATWIPSAQKRLKSPVGQFLAEKIIETQSDEWWFSDKDDTWWVSRDGANHQKRF